MLLGVAQGVLVGLLAVANNALSIANWEQTLLVCPRCSL